MRWSPRGRLSIRSARVGRTNRSAIANFIPLARGDRSPPTIFSRNPATRGGTPLHPMKSKLQLHHHASPEELAKAAATKFVGLLKRRSDLRRPFGVALSGGRIAKPFYDCIAK